MARPYYGQLNLSQYDPEVGRIWRSRDEELDPSPTWGMSDDLIVDPWAAKELADWLLKVLEAVDLTTSEQVVLQCRGLDYTLEEIGQKLKVTRERIRQIEAKALRKVRVAAKKRLHTEERDLESRLPKTFYTVWDIAGRPWFQGTQIECLQFVNANGDRAPFYEPLQILRNGKTPKFTRELT